MSVKSVMFLASVVMGLGVLAAVTPATAGGYGGSAGGFSHGPSCKTGGISIFKPVSINKNINISKNIAINKNINVFKPVNINKNIAINKNINVVKNINANKNININKVINANKNININKNIVINKGGGGGSAEASAMAAAFASAMASANASVTVNNNAGASAGAGASVAYYSNSYSDMKIVNKGGSMGAVHVQQHCQMQYASVIKAIHAVCVAANGMEFPASHMIPDTWISASYEGEVARCIPGAYIKATIGDVVQSSQGMAGTYQNGTVLKCGLHESLNHYKNGMLKCAPEVPVPDCTERTNLRRYGTGDLFFTFRAKVCVAPPARIDASITGMSLDGGVGDE